LGTQGRYDEASRRYREMLASGEPVPRCARTSCGQALLAPDRAEAEQQFQLDLPSCPVGKPEQARAALEDGGNKLPAHTEHELGPQAGDAFFKGDYPATAEAADTLRRKYPNHPAGWYWR
jgi:hypothetical protein